jgi:6-phosphogluconolactonase
MKVLLRAAAPTVSARGRITAALAAGFALLFTGTAMANSDGAVYTQTNSPTGNAVHRLDRDANGLLTPVATYRTGGVGTGAGLGSQGAVALSDDGRLLVAVDAGSNDIASFRVSRRGHLTLVDRQPSGGVTPNSVDIADGSVYVLNAGGAANVTGFDLDGSGKLRPRSTAALTAGAAGAAQVSVAPGGRDLVVSVRQSNRLETFPLRFGRIGAPVVTDSSGAVPFGFGFSPRGDLVVSEAGASTVSSYRLNGNGTARVVSASLPVGQAAACWVVVTADGRFAYTGNASGSISGYSIARDGALTALTAGGLTAAAPRPNDLAVAGRYLYAVNPAVGEVTAYRVENDGRLVALPGVAGLGAGQLAGLAAR